ncbi:MULTISPECIES: hypothetical protein [unclassified Marinobacter]|nr:MULTISPECIES: hypothetical protein [unclassified Marinobacter]
MPDGPSEPADETTTHALMLMMSSASLALLAASPNQLVLAAFSAVLFGLA